MSETWPAHTAQFLHKSVITLN